MDIFADTPRISDSLIDVCHEGVTPHEKHFERVLGFHGNILNGGLNQALFNMPEEIQFVPHSYRELGMNPLATIVELAIQKANIGDNWESVFDCPAHKLDDVYIAACYNLPYACNENQDDTEFPDSHNDIDWVDRMALKYARANRKHFHAIVAALK